MSHPNIVQMHDIATGTVDGELFYLGILDYFINKDLKSYLGEHEELRKDTPAMTQIFKEVLSGLNYLHTLPVPIIHGDIKPDNVLVSESGSCVISDFGLAQVGGPFMSARGTPAYISPEVAHSWFTDTASSWTGKVDIFAFGVLMVTTLLKSYPFPNINNVLRTRHTGEPASLDKLMASFTLRSKVKERIDTEIDPLFAQMIYGCLQIDPELRPSASELLTYLNAMYHM